MDTPKSQKSPRTPRTPNTPSSPRSPTPQIQTFTLWCNNKRHDFQGDIFAKMSMKCAQLVREGQTQGVIERRVRNEVFEAFVAACQLRPFKVVPSNAYELQALAFEWGVTSLEKFVADYIKEKNLKPPPEIDYLGVLLDHLEHGIDDPNDIIGVANIVNDALEDERFENVPPEIIFKILITADQKKLEQYRVGQPRQEQPKPDHQALDQRALIEFVLRLFESNPSSAVPLTLLIDYDQLTKEQRDVIFQCKLMHEQNIGYFIAHAMSATRNKAERELSQSEAQLLTDLNSLREGLKQHQRQTVSSLKKEQDESLGDLKDAFVKHQERLNELKALSNEHREELDRAREAHNNRFDQMKDKLEIIDAMTSQRSNIAAGMADRVDDEVAEQIDKLRIDVNNQLRNLATDDADQCDKLEQNLKKMIEGEQQRLKQLRNKLNQTQDSIKSTNETITDVQATLAAKIVHDRLKYDSFLRNTDSRFDVFTQDGGIWGLDVDDVKKAEKFVEQIENNIDQLCPIRGTNTSTTNA
ncbi:hypothetical protein TRFO_05028 [Tritrichomonas foetus]|uniref:Uncharacterized protein n=1 Tax=Tritrichomonas foetus TaxID=1144522 RepID=A0A1J4KE60_9EUKA|nr:hypothetical protein TRFO_05028 [Tritrichomonas foetus]|eukprot:OHT07918.1 hypothetical protein TRFO_05028 [Tritrichomonas foetus]